MRFMNGKEKKENERVKMEEKKKTETSAFIGQSKEKISKKEVVDNETKERDVVDRDGGLTEVNKMDVIKDHLSSSASVETDTSKKDSSFEDRELINSSENTQSPKTTIDYDKNEKLWIKLECDFLLKPNEINATNIEKNKSDIRSFLNDLRSNCGIEPGNVEVPFDASFRVSKDQEKIKFPVQQPYSPDFITYGISSIEYREGYIFLKGMPEKGYEGGLLIKLSIKYYDYVTLPDGSQGIAKIEARTDSLLSFVINQKPEDMWKNIDPPQDAPYQKKNSVCNSLCLEGMGKVILAASQRGRSHAHNGTFRDDDYAIYFDHKTGWCYLAVADGAGSAEFSREGSRIACAKSVELAPIAFTNCELNNIDQDDVYVKGLINSTMDEAIVRDELFLHAFHSILYTTQHLIEEEAKKNSYVVDKAKKHKTPLSSYFHTTLLFAAVKKLKDWWLIVTYWVGDGGLVILNSGNCDNVLLMGQPDTGEYAGQTKFFTMRDEANAENPEPYRKRIHVAVLKDFESIFMMTDGVTDPFFPAEENIGDLDYWHKFMQESIPNHFPGVFDKSQSIKNRAESLLKGLNFYSKGQHDDRTMLIVTNEK